MANPSPAAVRVTHLTTLHPPDDVRIFVKECRTLAQHGYEVHLAARVSRSTERDGVLVEPIGTTEIRTGIQNLVPRLARALRAARRAKTRLYHLHDPELIPVGLALKLLGARVVYDAHEDTPVEVLTITENPGFGARALSWGWRAADRAVARWFDAVVAATPAIARKFPPQKTALVRNFPLSEELESFAGAPFDERPLEVVYAGALTAARGVRQMVEAMSRVPTEGARLVLAGTFESPGLLDEMSRARGWERVEYVGLVPRARMGAAFGRARVALLLFEPRGAHLVALPNKLFEYMSAGLPIVASDFPPWREIIAGERCGLLVDPLDVDEIATVVEWLLAHPAEAEAMGRRGSRAVASRYNWEGEAQKLLALYQRLSG